MIMSLSPKPVVSKRPFIVMAYVANAKGIPRPQKPVKCPTLNHDNKSCRIHMERWRKRLCGFSFRLAGMNCLPHSLSFTIYPPGAAPYGRQPLLLMDHAGGVVEQVARSLEFSVLAKYAFGLAQLFNAFYHRSPILKEERADRKRWRAGAVAYVRAQLTQTLALMGIEVPARM